MNFLIIGAHYPPHMGGVENYMFHLQEQLVKDGHHVVIVTSEEMGLSGVDRASDALEIFRLPSFLPMNGRYPVVKSFSGRTRRMLRDLADSHFDICLVNTRFYPLSLLGIRFAYENHIRTIVIEHGTSHLSVHNQILDSFGARWEHFITRQGQKYHPEYAGVSKATLQWLRHFGIKGQYVFYNAIDLDAIDKIRKSGEADYRSEYKIPSDSIIVTFSGRLLEEKGIPQLLECADKIHAKNCKVHFFLAGDGPLLDMAKEAAEQNDRIHVLGRIDMPHMISLLDQSDIFCLPSYSEGFSTSVLEAAACKAYIITTYRGGSRELIDDPKYGCIIQDNAVEHLLPAMENAIAHPDVCRKAAEACYDRLKANFTWKQTAAEVERVSENA